MAFAFKGEDQHTGHKKQSDSWLDEWNFHKKGRDRFLYAVRKWFFVLLLSSQVMMAQEVIFPRHFSVFHRQIDARK